MLHYYIIIITKLSYIILNHLNLAGLEKTFFSGGSDSKLYVWNDVTQLEEMKRLDEAESNLLLEQQLQNDIRNKRYDKVFMCILYTCVWFIFMYLSLFP
jgi:hypothetical protein